MTPTNFVAASGFREAARPDARARLARELDTAPTAEPGTRAPRQAGKPDPAQAPDALTPGDTADTARRQREDLAEQIFRPTF